MPVILIEEFGRVRQFAALAEFTIPHAAFDFQAV